MSKIQNTTFKILALGLLAAALVSFMPTAARADVCVCGPGNITPDSSCPAATTAGFDCISVLGECTCQAGAFSASDASKCGGAGIVETYKLPKGTAYSATCSYKITAPAEAPAAGGSSGNTCPTCVCNSKTSKGEAIVITKATDQKSCDTACSEYPIKGGVCSGAAAPGGTPAAGGSSSAKPECFVGPDYKAPGGLLAGVSDSCGRCGNCQLTDFFVVGNNVFRLLIGLSGSFALLMVIYGGFMWLTSGGSSERIEKGKKVLVGAVIGLIIVFGAYTVVELILAAAGVKGVPALLNRPFGR